MREKKQVVHELNEQLQKLRSLTGQDGVSADEIRQTSETVERLTDELNQINIAEAAERAAAKAQADNQDGELKKLARRFSIAKFIRELGAESKGGLTGVEAEVARMGEEEAARNNVKLIGAAIPMSILNARDFGGQNVTTQADGGYLVGTELQYQEALRKRLVLVNAGAAYVGGLVGNITLIEGTGVSVSWEGENDEVADSKKSFSTRDAKPKRCAVNVPISKQLAIQSSFDVDQLIMSDIYAAHAEALEAAALNGSGSGEPTGLLNTSSVKTVEMGTNGAVPDFASMVKLETEIALQNADQVSMAYISNPKIRGLLKTTLKANNVPGYIWERNEVNGYPIYTSNLVPSNLTKGTSASKCSAILFGDWSKLWIMSWGGLDIVVDPYSLKKQGAYEVTLNAYHDIFVRRKEAFAVIKDALTE